MENYRQASNAFGGIDSYFGVGKAFDSYFGVGKAFDGVDSSFGLGKAFDGVDSSFGLGKAFDGVDSSFGLGKAFDGVDSSFGLGKAFDGVDSSFGLGKAFDSKFGLGKALDSYYGVGKAFEDFAATQLVTSPQTALVYGQIGKAFDTFVNAPPLAYDSFRWQASATASESIEPSALLQWFEDVSLLARSPVFLTAMHALTAIILQVYSETKTTPPFHVLLLLIILLGIADVWAVSSRKSDS